MMTKLALAAVCVALTAGCATTPATKVAANGSANGATGAAAYCWKERLASEGGKLVCNWEASVAEACRSNGTAATTRTASGEPQPAGMCSNGQWLVKVPAA